MKTTSDLLALRSDAYVITEDGRAMLAPERNGIPPEIDLDGNHFKLVDQLESALADGVPSLLIAADSKCAGRRASLLPTVSRATWSSRSDPRAHERGLEFGSRALINRTSGSRIPALF